MAVYNTNTFINYEKKAFEYPYKCQYGLKQETLAWSVYKAYKLGLEMTWHINYFSGPEITKSFDASFFKELEDQHKIKDFMNYNILLDQNIEADIGDAKMTSADANMFGLASEHIYYEDGNWESTVLTIKYNGDEYEVLSTGLDWYDPDVVAVNAFRRAVGDYDMHHNRFYYVHVEEVK